MGNFLAPPAHKPEMTGNVDKEYKKLRWQVFLGIFIGYAGFYIVRKNFSMAIPGLEKLGFETGELAIVLSMNAIAYGFSKFLMASISDRSDARKFLPLGLVMAALSMAFMIVPVKWLGIEHKAWAILLMAVLNFLVGWFNGMDSLREGHDPLVLNQGKRHMDVVLELRPQRWRSPCRTYGDLRRDLVRFMVLRSPFRILLHYRFIRLPCRCSHTDCGHSLLHDPRHASVMRPSVDREVVRPCRPDIFREG